MISQIGLLTSATATKAATACVWALLFSVIVLSAQPGPPDLYAQATSIALNRSFPSERVEYLLLDVRTRQVVAFRWRHVDSPIPVGSLLKPFLALAYSQMESDRSSPQPRARTQFPVVQCHGKLDGCWHAGGHGSVTLEQALAKSCNAYFLALAGRLSNSSYGIDVLNHVSTAYGLPAPPWPGSETDVSKQATPRMLIGLTPEWRVSPIALARAYATLTAQSGNEAMTRILTGMKMAASPGGTAARVAQFAELGQNSDALLAKTGTAPCVPDDELKLGRCRASGDGLVVILAPAENPRLLLLVRQRGTTGAQASEVAGRMLAEVSHAEPR